MSTSLDRRTRKRLATRQSISDVATRLFIERGFDAVTVDEIAAAADVGRMTVFNHFPRKEDLFFDRDGEARALILAAVRERHPHVAPLEALGRLAHRALAGPHPPIEFSAGSLNWFEAVERTATRRARARAIRDELAQVVATSLAHAVGRAPADPAAQLAASLLLAIWTAALLQGHRSFRSSRDAAAATAAFLAVVERGMTGLRAAVAGTPYDRPTS